MNLWNAVTYPFHEQNWLSKLAFVTVLTTLSFIPLIGLIPFAILLGYMVGIVQNMTLQHDTLLPPIKDYGKMLRNGALVLSVTIIYNLPLVLFVAGSWLFSQSLGSGAFGTSVILSVALCALPLSIGYVFIVWPVLAVAVIRFSQWGNSEALFRLSDHITTVRSNVRVSIQWILFALLTILVFTLAGIIPVLGWLFGIALFFPTQTHLVGQFAQEIT